MNRFPSSKLRAGMLLGFLLAMLTIMPNLAADQARRPTTQDDPGAAICRYGAAVTGTLPARMDVIPRLGAGWYLTFDTFLPEDRPSNGAEFVRLVHVKQVKTANGEYWVSPILL